jgi:hypothetical protein
MFEARKLTPHEERAVAVRAGCDPRSVRAFLEGRSQRSTVAARIAEALREYESRPTEPPPRAA